MRTAILSCSHTARRVGTLTAAVIPLTATFSTAYSIQHNNNTEQTNRAYVADIYECPDAAFMCNDPGLLTCLGELDDCSGKGDCLKGNCYCHSGFGGADCSVAACIAEIGCEDVRFLPLVDRSAGPAQSTYHKAHNCLSCTNQAHSTK